MAINSEEANKNRAAKLKDVKPFYTAYQQAMTATNLAKANYDKEMKKSAIDQKNVDNSEILHDGRTMELKIAK